MKRFLLLIVSLMIMMCANAQFKVNVIVDMNGTYGEMSVDEMLAKNGTQFLPVWKESKEQIFTDVVATLRQHPYFKSLDFGRYDDAVFTLKFTLNTMEKNGDIRGELFISKMLDESYRKVIFVEKFNQDGESTKDFTRFTSKAFTRVADRLSDQLVNAIRANSKDVTATTTAHKTTAAEQQARKQQATAKPRSYAINGYASTKKSASSSKRTVLNRALEEHQECVTGALTRSGGILVFADNSTQTSSVAHAVERDLKTMNEKGRTIRDLNVSEKDNYIIIDAEGGVLYNGVPKPMREALNTYTKSNERVMAAAFNENSRWIIITNQHWQASDVDATRFMKTAMKMCGGISYVYVSDKGGKLAIGTRGIYYEDIPQNLATQLNDISFIPQSVKFTDEGHYLITDGENTCSYLL